ncbi:MAG: twin-arginine translocase TatA/TatE family subunit [Pseudonocardiales bacterium]|nr:twin-arginine translocase TatA/TatE family subunit [Pseudonocardiales bacterium]MBV9029276.1 twin-arginine translocase TatA/TatE family subunit [Pseudonocardiales bacterium]MBW0010446.1 twin-arginine translocase TatA/TatE family subunit [Pseudonocardiales bacterium]
MFDLSIEKLFILAVVALFVLGPERLPTAATWLARTIRQIKNYTNEANQKIRDQLGPEFDEIREPLNDLRSNLGSMRSWRDPRSALLRHLRDDPITPYRYPPPPGSWEELVNWEPTPNQQPAIPPLPLAVGERPPIDPEAT